MLISQDRRGERKNTFGSFRYRYIYTYILSYDINTFESNTFEYQKKMAQENTDAYEDVQFTITLGKESSLV